MILFLMGAILLGAPVGFMACALLTIGKMADERAAREAVHRTSFETATARKALRTNPVRGTWWA